MLSKMHDKCQRCDVRVSRVYDVCHRNTMRDVGMYICCVSSLYNRERNLNCGPFEL